MSGHSVPSDTWLDSTRRNLCFPGESLAGRCPRTSTLRFPVREFLWLTSLAAVLTHLSGGITGVCLANEVPGTLPPKSTWNVKASKSQSRELVADFAIDDDLATRWSSPFEDGHWLEIDLGRPVPIVGARLHWEVARAKRYRVLHSNNGEAWEVCRSIKKDRGNVDHLYFPPVKARYWRLVCDERATKWGASMWEADLFGAESQPRISEFPNNRPSSIASVLDGDLKTTWQVSGEPQRHVVIDLRQPFDLGGVRVLWGSAPTGTASLEIAEDRRKWTRITTAQVSSGDKYTDLLGPKFSTKLIRVTLALASDDSRPSTIREIELRGPDEAVRQVVACPCASSEQSRDADGFDLRATGHDSRIDLQWAPSRSESTRGYNIYRAETRTGQFRRLNVGLHKLPFYSDFLSENDVKRFYRIAEVSNDFAESDLSDVVAATSYAMTDEELLTSVQQATFRYFWDFADPNSGLSRESYYTHPCETCTSGGTGFGMMTIVVGAERGFVGRRQAAKRLLRTVRFLDEKATRYHGVWAHWINGTTGRTIPFAGPADNGGDLVETAFLVQGMLTVRQYFDRNNAVESELRDRITRLWRTVEWDWYLREPGNKRLYWHWSPDYHWKMNHQFVGFNECLITYLLAIASPTHSIPAECYYEGWVGDQTRYVDGTQYFGIRKPVGRVAGEPLFFTHYSFLGLDPRAFTDRFTNYFENNRNATLINRAYCMANPGRHQGYNKLFWGLTSSQNPDGYKAHGPAINRDDGTVTPTAAISAMPYTPRESIATLRHFYHDYGQRLWGPMGFYDAINLDRDWVSPGYLAIDQGTIVPMIENYRTQLCWKLFMSNPEIAPMLDKLGELSELR